MTTLPGALPHSIPAASESARFSHQVNPYLLLTLILIVAAVLRFNGLDREGRWGDEYFQTMQYSGSPWQVVLGARSNNQPPLDYLIGWAVTKLARTTWMMRAPAAVFGVAGVGALFLLARKLFGVGTALLAAALLALAPMHWKLSQEARPYTIFICSMLVTLWLLFRAFERPTLGRVLAFGLSAVCMTLTRGLDPQVVLLCCGLVLTCMWLRGFVRGRAGALQPCLVADAPRHGESPLATGSDPMALGRVWFATISACLVGAAVVLFLIRGDAGWTVFAAEEPARGTGLSGVLAVVARNARIWYYAPNTLFGRGALPMMVLAVLGSTWCLLRWRSWAPATRCVLAVMWLCGPVYLLVYSVAVASNPICDRYALFLVPVVVTFAAVMIVEFLRHSFSHEGNRRTRAAACFICLAVVLLPAVSTVALSRQYFHPDWRGTAEHLSGRYAAGDVVMVFADRPLGEGQSPYWGKLDWTVGDAPLGEAMWTLAISETHWQRLTRSNGRCCVVVKYFVGEQQREDYFRMGLRVAPVGLQLSKFRGLEVLEGFGGQDLASRLASACDTVLGLPQLHFESRAIAYVLRSRAELWSGRVEQARASYAEAQVCVPAEKRVWFERATQVHRAALATAASIEH